MNLNHYFVKHPQNGGMQSSQICYNTATRVISTGPGVGELLARRVVGQLEPADAEILRILAPERQFAGMEMLK